MLYPLVVCCCIHLSFAAVSTRRLLLYPLVVCCCIHLSFAAVSTRRLLLYPLVVCCCIHLSFAAVSTCRLLLYPLVVCCCIHLSFAAVSTCRLLPYPLGACRTLLIDIHLQCLYCLCSLPIIHVVVYFSGATRCVYSQNFRHNVASIKVVTGRYPGVIRTCMSLSCDIVQGKSYVIM